MEDDISISIVSGSECAAVALRRVRDSQPVATQQILRARNSHSESDTTNPPGKQPPPVSIALRLSDVRRTEFGIVFGSRENCHVVIKGEGISSSHCALALDDYNRLVIRDLGSDTGSQVTYSGEGEGRRQNFQWIIHGTPKDSIAGKEIVLDIGETCRFHILLEGSGLFCQPATQPPSGTHALGHDKIYLAKELGRGMFGVVDHYWDVSTGEQFAVKRPRKKLLPRQEREAWAREAEIMAALSHNSIVRLFRYQLEESPRLWLEYCPLGPLTNIPPPSSSETLSILCQCLSALIYLHERCPPVVHRDLKPDNILVFHRSDDAIHIKLADFGLAKAMESYVSYCGTPVYMAPEVAENRNISSSSPPKGYTVSADIWSLGVVAYQLLVGDLPTYLEEYEETPRLWSKAIIKAFNQNRQKYPNGLKDLILDHMLHLDPSSRSSARLCHEMAMHLSAAEAQGTAMYPTFHGPGSGGNTIKQSQITGQSTLTQAHQTVRAPPGVDGNGLVGSSGQGGATSASYRPSHGQSGVAQPDINAGPSSSGHADHVVPLSEVAQLAPAQSSAGNQVPPWVPTQRTYRRMRRNEEKDLNRR